MPRAPARHACIGVEWLICHLSVNDDWPFVGLQDMQGQGVDAYVNAYRKKGKWKGRASARCAAWDSDRDYVG